MRTTFSTTAWLAAGLLIGGAVQAQSLGGLKHMGSLKELSGADSELSGTPFSLPASAGNAAGLLGYCVDNNYLSNADKASQLKHQLLGKSSGQRQDPGYQDGEKGILRGKSGHSLNLGQLDGDYKDKIAHKVCKLVLDKGKSLL